MSTVAEAILQWAVLVVFALWLPVRYWWLQTIEAGLRIKDAGSDYDDSPHEWVMNNLPDDIQKELRRG